MKCKTIFSPSADDPGLKCGPGVTEQHHKDRVDINNIMSKYTITGLLPDITEKMAVYGDFSDVGDFLESQLKVKEAQDAFMLLDAKIRKRFDNDPAKLMEFIQDKSNIQEAISLGLVDSKPISPVKQEPILDQNKQN